LESSSSPFLISDLFYILPLLYGAFVGFRKGFISEVISILALVLAIFGALKLSPYLGSFLNSNWDISPDYLPVVTFAICMVLIFIVVIMAGKLMEGLINMVALGLFNKIAGIFFGIGKWALILGCIVYVLTDLDTEGNRISQETKDKSLFYKPLYSNSSKLIEALGGSDWGKSLEGMEDLDDLSEQDFYLNKKSE
jgi:membrane protein required for colicin V production